MGSYLGPKGEVPEERWQGGGDGVIGLGMVSEGAEAGMTEASWTSQACANYLETYITETPGNDKRYTNCAPHSETGV